MPLHEYECKQCGRRTEKIQKFSDAPLTVCPHCGGALEQLLHAPALSFKGGGWYADLYSSAKPSGSGEAKGPGDAKASGDTKSDGGSPAKPGGDSSSGAAAAPANTPAPSTAASAPASSSSSDKK